MHFGHFVTTLNNTFETKLAQKHEGYESGVKASTSPPLSAVHRESTMSQQWRGYPSILQTLVNHQLHQSIMKNTALKDIDITTLHTAD